jgi:FecR protein
MKIRYACRAFLTMAMAGGAVFAVGQSSRPLSAVELQERGQLNGSAQDSAVVPETVAPGSKQTSDAAVNTETAAKQEATAKQDSDTPQDSAMQAGDSHVRIVRLSEMKGEVWMDRKTGQGFEQTMQNMPIVEGMRLRTKAGTAEVEFEDGSTLRAAPDTVIAFPQLVRRGAGGTATAVKLVQGMMYVNLSGTKGNSFTMQAGTREMTVEPATHARLEMTGAKTVVAVFNGGVEVQAATGMTLVGKKETLTLSGDAGDVELAKNVEKGSYDAWDKELNEYHERNMRGNSFASSSSGYGYGYGAADLNYYGSFANIGGCGQVWQPYFTSAGWSPYGNGLWAAYPGAGYSWVSPYPWGWLPYHSGQWVNCGGAGWGWQPGGGFVGLNNIAGLGALQTRRTLGGSATSSGVAPRPPQPGGASLVVQAHGQIFSGVKGDGFVFAKDSAGMGVPRGQLGDLHGISQQVQRHGMMSMPIDAQTMVHGKGGEVARGPVNLRPAGSAQVGSAGTFRGGEPGGGGGNAGASSHGGNYSGGGMGGGNHSAPPPPPPSAPAAAPAAAASGHK